jgi:hypothetical protein
MVALCRKMKEAIDEGRYTVLVSDEVGGRIPTLVLRKVIKELHPDKELKTLFVASGQSSQLPDYDKEIDKENYKKLHEYLRRAAGFEDYVLLVTQFVYSGKTVEKLSTALQRAGEGLRGLDVAATSSFGLSEDELRKGIITSDDDEAFYTTRAPRSGRLIPADNIYVGNSHIDSTKELEKRHNRFTGVSKEREYSPSPILYTKALEKYGKYMNYYSDEELREIFGIEAGDSAETIFTKKWETPENVRKYKELAEKPLSDGERKKLAEDIKKAREDVDTLAQAILKEVWGL